ncbi:C-C motif chemokine 24 [Microtus ochrogaster]|uniref:C-C motif chemokine 24 n=1 Tax=Microtus ochrogaster TaxID=79684 RepID=A0A8J6GDG6_MICOH|nr:C-C motif chemokine 24 [Microtus ochrogaster]
MAGSTTVIASLLLLVACMGYIFPTDSATIPSSCCMSFVSKKIPRHRVVSYQLANGSVCPKAGVMLGHGFLVFHCGSPYLPSCDLSIAPVSSLSHSAIVDTAWGKPTQKASL